MIFISINEADLPKQLVKILEREFSLKSEVAKINERYETALNLKNDQEIEVLVGESEKLNQRMDSHIAEKVVVMSIYVGQNRQFKNN